MIRGMETAAQAMRTQAAREDVLGQNLINLRIPGYKQETASVGGFATALSRATGSSQGGLLTASARSAPIGDLGLGSAIDSVFVDFSQGQLEETKRPLDVALDGDGFLTVRTPEGDVYSRGGALQVDGTGRLVTDEGYPVLSGGNEITLPSGSYSIGPDGGIKVDGKVVANLGVVEFPPGTEMAKVADLLYAPSDPAAVASPAVATSVKGGFMEQSNVDDVSTLSEMASLVRVYQMNQRMLQAEDEILGKAVDEVGKV